MTEFFPVDESFVWSGKFSEIKPENAIIALGLDDQWSTLLHVFENRVSGETHVTIKTRKGLVTVVCVNHNLIPVLIWLQKELDLDIYTEHKPSGGTEIWRSMQADRLYTSQKQSELPVSSFVRFAISAVIE